MGVETCVKKNFIAMEGGNPLSDRSRGEPLHGFWPTAWYIIIDAPKMKPIPCGPSVLSGDFEYMIAMFSASWSLMLKGVSRLSCAQAFQVVTQGFSQLDQSFPFLQELRMRPWYANHACVVVVIHRTWIR